MPYSIQTKDGIKINNIPDDVDPQSEQLRARVAQIRESQQGAAPTVTPVPAEAVPQVAEQAPIRPDILRFMQTARSDVPVAQREAAFRAQVAKGLPEQAALEQALFPTTLAEGAEFAKGIPGAIPTAASGLLGTAAGGVSGLATALTPGAEPGSGAAVAKGVQERLTIPPVGEAAQKTLGAFGESAAGLEEITSIPEEAVFEATGSPIAATGALVAKEIIPTLLGVKAGQIAAKTAVEASKSSGNAIVEGVKSIGQRAKDIATGDTPTKVYLRERIEANDPSVEFLGKKIEGKEIIQKPSVAAAQKQGFEDKALRSVETANPQTKAAYRDMIKTLKRRRIDGDFAASRRITDVVGKNVFKRYKALNKLKERTGDAVGKAAESLRGKDFDFEAPTSRLFEELKQVGVAIRKNQEGKFKADFSEVDASQIAGTKTAIESIINRMNKLKSVKAFDAHKMKKLVDSSIDFGKLPSADSKLAQGVESALKRYRFNINEKLGAEFPDYAKANKAFSEIVEPLSDMDRVFKTMMNVKSKEALEAGVGTRAARTLMSNNAGRAAMLDLLKNTDEVLAKNGRKFDDDMIKQAVFADEIERVFGSEATTSLGGASQRATEAAIRATFGANIIPEIAIKGLDKLRNVNPDEAIKALEAMINSSP